MSSIWFLMGLLLLAYMGSFLFGGHAIRGFGLPSSAEYVVLGFVLGPLLGLLDRSTLSGFDALTNVAVGWLALLAGLEFGFVRGERARAKSIAVGALLVLVTGACIFGAVSLVFVSSPWLMLAAAPQLRGADRWLLAGGVAVACAETTRHAVRWVMERHGASGPLSRLLGEVADADDLVVIIATAVLFSLKPPEHSHVHLPAWGYTLLTLGLGVGMGVLATLLLGREFRVDESWGVLLGTSLLSIGLSAQAGLSPLTTMFVMGAAISVLSRHRSDISAMALLTERAALLPTLLVAGARLDFGASRVLPYIIVLTILARVFAKGLTGLSLRALMPGARGARRWLGFGLLSTGGLSMSIGLAFALRFPGAVGDTVLATAAALTVFGEFVGPQTLRAVLRQAGELRVEGEAPEGDGGPGGEGSAGEAAAQ